MKAMQIWVFVCGCLLLSTPWAWAYEKDVSLQAQAHSLVGKDSGRTASVGATSAVQGVAHSVTLDASLAQVVANNPMQGAAPNPQGGLETVFTEDFEGGMDGAWVLADADTGSSDTYWGAVTCHAAPHGGSWVGWCAASSMTPCSSYDTDMQAWMIYGPFSLANCDAANLQFYLANESEVDFDSVAWYVSSDGSNFNGYYLDGVTSGYPTTWGYVDFDLSAVGDTDPCNYCGLSQVWIALYFESDYSITEGGTYVDDLVLTRNVAGISLPDLRPYQVSGWDDILPLSHTSGSTTTDAMLYDDSTIYLNYSCLNDGTVDIGAFKYGIWIDGIQRKAATPSSLQAGYYSYVTGSDLGTLTAGQHTVELRCDYDNEIIESNETNNEYTRVITVSSRDGSISGSKWNDLDSDGVWDGGEPGLANWFIYLDSNGNGAWDTGEASDYTDANGDYSFTGLSAGSYVVAEQQQAGWTQTYPATSGASAQTQLASGPSTYYDQMTEEEQAGLEMMVMDSPPYPPLGVQAGVALDAMPQSAVMLDVPTSTWTYGCSATSAGMIFGYYDRNGYPDMYTGPTNGGVCPLTDLGQGDIPASPIAGACSIIATQQGFDGRAIRGHVDDYWISYNSAGPDPFEGSWAEHTWGDCTTDYMGTNQWKWDTNTDGTIDYNVDGSTVFWTSNDGSKLYDFIPSATYGLPQTAGCHGMRLFAESRGYTVVENYSQKIDTVEAGGFSFADYMNEIDAGRPVMLQVTGHSMVGVGYEASSNLVYLHDTWDNSVHSMTWGGSYQSMDHYAVTVIVLAAEAPDGTHQVILEAGQMDAGDINFGNANDAPSCGDWGYLGSDLNTDCRVDMIDFGMMASEWMLCTDPVVPGCINVN